MKLNQEDVYMLMSYADYLHYYDRDDPRVKATKKEMIAIVRRL